MLVMPYKRSAGLVFALLDIDQISTHNIYYYNKSIVAFLKSQTIYRYM